MSGKNHGSPSPHATALKPMGAAILVLLLASLHQKEKFFFLFYLCVSVFLMLSPSYNFYDRPLQIH